MLKSIIVEHEHVHVYGVVTKTVGMDLYNHMSECTQVEVHSTKLTPNMQYKYGLH